MGKRQFTFDGTDELVNKLTKLTDIYPVLKASLYDGAGVLADEIKKRAPEVLKKSISVSKMDNGNGKVTTAVVFAGYDNTHPTKQFPSGVPYALIAAAYESGTSERKTQKGYGRGSVTKHPFIRPSVKACEDRAKAAMQEQMDEQIKTIMEG